MKLQIEIPKKELMFVLVPESVRKCKVVNYGYAGVYLMESDSKELNVWKMKLPNGKYEPIGRIEDVVFGIENLCEVETDKNFILRIL